MEQIGRCKVCGKEEDLRFGACFDCADYVKVKRISPTTYRLWDERNPSNEWFASETHN